MKGKVRIACALALVLGLATGASAAQISVTSTADSGPGSLRAALAAANDGDIIVFSLPLPATINLTSGELLIEDDVTISGPGRALLTVQRATSAGMMRIFRVVPDTTVSLSGMTIAGGWTEGDYGAGAYGGGIYNEGDLTLTGVVVRGNSGMYGGGIETQTNLTIIDSAIIDNAATDNYYGGGGIAYCCGDATITIIGSTIAGNTGPGYATAIATYAYGSNATVRIKNSTIDGTWSNEAYEVSFVFDSSTVTSSEPDFPLFYDWYSYASLSYRNSIFQAPSGQSVQLYFGSATSLGYNIFSDASGNLTQPTDHPSTDALLGPLQDNGGATKTRALLAGSPAIDAGDCVDSQGASVDADQRGVVRPRGNGCDIGAFEAASDHELQLDVLLQTVATQLDAPLSSRASQASIDAVAGSVSAVAASITSLTSGMTAGFAAVQANIATLAASIPSSASMSALETAVSNLSADVATRSTQESVDTSAAAATRIAIERALSDGIRVVWFMLPASAGGQLDLVRQIVGASLAGMQSIGVDVARAQADFNKGEIAFGAGDYRTAYAWYGSAYQKLQR